MGNASPFVSSSWRSPFTPKDYKNFASTMLTYLNEIDGRSDLKYKGSRVLTRTDLAPTTSAKPYIYLREDVFDAIRSSGCLRFAPLEYYRTVEGGGRDSFEGYATVAIRSTTGQMIVTAIAGRHNLILSTSESVGPRPELMNKFGPRVVQIENILEFAGAMAGALGQ